MCSAAERRFCGVMELELKLELESTEGRSAGVEK